MNKEKSFRVTLAFNINWHIDDFEDGKWPDNEILKQMSSENIIKDNLNTEGEESRILISVLQTE